jgi:hypothetical protein
MREAVMAGLRNVCVFGLAMSAGAPALAAPLCGAGVTDDALRPLPPALVDRAKQEFGLAMPDDLVARTTLMRCFDGQVLICNEGANLPCGKANLSRDLPGTAAWCRANPQASMVPAFATGHDTIYTWTCDHGVPRAGEPVQAVDQRGFIKQFWRKAD